MFELQDGKVTFKANDEKATKAAGRSFTIKVDSERLSKLQGILSHSGWKNPVKSTASAASKWYAEQMALKEIALKLLDLVIGEHAAK